jgi:hypothetical protein
MKPGQLVQLCPIHALTLLDFLDVRLDIAPLMSDGSGELRPECSLDSPPVRWSGGSSGSVHEGVFTLCLIHNPLEAHVMHILDLGQRDIPVHQAGGIHTVEQCRWQRDLHRQ